MSPSHNCSFVTAIALAWPPARWKDHRTLIAVSGGADSVALAHAMRAIASEDSRKLVLAHFNHRWRGEESDADEKFLQQLSKKLDLELRLGRANEPPSQTNAGRGAEGTARQARYEFLADVAKESGARYIVTAHTADDQVETVLHRIMRGTGIAGLQGIPRFRSIAESVTLVRPMLEISRCEVLQFLKDLNQDFCTDSSNVDTRYTRNKIRHEVLPYLTEHFGEQVSANLAKLAEQAAAVQQILDQRIKALMETSVEFSAESSIIRTDRIRSQPIHVIRELLKRIWQHHNWPLRDMTFEHWDELAQMVCEKGSDLKKNFPGNVVVRKFANELCLSRRS